MDLQAASQEVQSTTTQLVDSVNRFEIMKRRDLKACLSDMVWNDIQFHAKALENLSQLHFDLNQRDLDADLLEIRDRISLASKPGGSRPSSPARSKSASPDKKSTIESPRKASLRSASRTLQSDAGNRPEAPELAK